jgi:hypothetical protein
MVAVVSVAVLVSARAHACADTSVRLAAFQTPRDVHTLCVIGDDGDETAGDAAARLKDWIENEGGDLNLEVVRVSADDPGVQWQDYALPSAPPDLPVVALIGRQTATRRAFVIDHWEPSPTGETLATLASSPVREAIKERVVDDLAVLLYAPGIGDEGGEMEPIVRAAVERFESAAPASDLDPSTVSVVKLDRKDPRERVLCSFAGITERGPDWVGVVFGRGKLVAPPLVGREIREDNLTALLASLQLPCTCLESPATLGVDIPMRWEESLDALIAPLLAPAYSEGVFGEEGVLREPQVPAATAAAVEAAVAEPERRLFTATVVFGAGAVIIVGAAACHTLVRWQRRRAAL